MHKEKTEAVSLFVCIKLKVCSGRRKRSESETAKRFGWGHNRGASAPGGSARMSPVNLNTMPSP